MIFSLFRHCYRTDTVDQEDNYMINLRPLTSYSEQYMCSDSTRWRPSLYPILEDYGECDHLTTKVSLTCAKLKTKKMISFSYKLKKVW